MKVYLRIICLLFLTVEFTASSSNDTENYGINFRVDIVEPPKDNSQDDNDDYYFEYFEDPRNEIPYTHYKKWQNGWRKYPLYIIILGGFRWDLLNQERMESLKSFAYLRQHGTTIPQVTPSFPPEDYSVWTSIATGLYTEDHGILGDYMFDLKERVFFNKSNSEASRNPNWWEHVNPLWATARKYNRKVAIYNWHDCNMQENKNLSSKNCHPYKRMMDQTSRQKVAIHFNEAFNKIHRSKYDLSIVYSDVIRRAAEIHGTDSPALTRVLKDVDDILQAKLTDIRSKTKFGLKMNMMVLSDYGITNLQETTTLYLDEIFNLRNVQYIIYASGYATLVPYALKHESILSVCSDIKGLKCYLTSHIQNPPIPFSKILPENLHYRMGEYVQDIVILADLAYGFDVKSKNAKVVPVNRFVRGQRSAGSGWNTRPVEPFFKKLGKGIKFSEASEEFNNSYTDYHNFHKFKDDMKTVGYAMGPDFKIKYVLPNPMETVDIYQLICFLLQIPPEAHSGNWKRVEPMLRISSATETTPTFVFTTLIMSLLFLLR